MRRGPLAAALAGVLLLGTTVFGVSRWPDAWRRRGAETLRPVLGAFEGPRPAVADDDVVLATIARVAPPPERCVGGEVFFSGPTTRRVIALSFDDGPSASVTPGVLQVLREHGVHATFFVLGERAERSPDTLRAIVQDGHELGNHGWSHRSFRSMFPSEITDELDRTAAAIERAGGVRPALVRPPFGRYPESTVALAAGRGEDLVLWSVDSGDTEGSDALGIANAVVRHAEPGAIVLLHDRNPATWRALPLILGGLDRAGLRVVPVSELLARTCTR